MKSNKGFTLIELLVVIAIIGILSSVVLASLNTARDRGANAAAQANLNNSRAQAELYYDSQNPIKSYTGVCTNNGGIGNLVAAATSSVGDNGTNPARCEDGGTNATSWRAFVALKGDNFYCVNSLGFAGIVTGSSLGTYPNCQ